jgi:cytoskeletal protein CcmA (bactofilin family)
VPIQNDARTGPSTPITSSSSGNSSGPAARTPSHLGQDMRIKGQIRGDEDLRIDGNVEGPISLGNHRLTVGQTGEILGEITAREIVVYGKVKGNLRALDRIEIKKDASVMGDLTTVRIMIDEGAYVKATIEIERGEAKAVPVYPDTDLAQSERDVKLKAIRSAASD